ncbi:serine/threonine protein kinase [Acidobacteria bacterium ACD]|nr:MAG: serine/threonine protein kinase [Acidobacteriota bacterium]MCE7960497.1 serine/threonine protein kinase [Acidobacteria bacterium ACB2]MDL1951864.1 serine/threonine protein kinase [Acidobacteria bacterium ACD]
MPLDQAVLGDRVGQGVSGHVFRATHAVTGEPMAIKIYPFQGVDPAFRPRERFWRECKILATVTHPAFPALYGCGTTDDDNGYALMEWITGRPLDTLRSLPVDDVLALATRILLGLRALHRHGFVHRDIAFDNVLVEERATGRTPRLIDLGAAKDLSLPGDVTHPGSFLGRPRFAPPEALTPSGSVAVRDPRADVFAFGVLLFEWLSGRPPFPGELPGDVLRSQQRPTLPRLVVPKERGGGDDRLQTFVHSLLRLDVAERPTADVALSAILDIRRHRPLPRPAPRPSDPEALVAEGPPGQFALRPWEGHREPLLDRVEAVEASEWNTAMGRHLPEYSRVGMPAVAAGADVPPPAVASSNAAPVGLGNIVEEVSRNPLGGRLVLALGILAFAAACVLAWVLLTTR